MQRFESVVPAGVRSALVIITVGMVLSCNTSTPKQEPQLDVPVVASGPNPKKGADLHLGMATTVEGTNAIRIELFLSDGDSGFYSKRAGEVRNILFVERGEKVARWLLPDNDHRVFDLSDLTDDKDLNRHHVLTSAALVKPAMDTAPTGKLLIFDPVGKNIVTVAENVSRVDLSTFVAGEVLLLYERDRKLVQAAYDPKSLAKLRELEIDVPKLSPPVKH